MSKKRKLIEDIPGPPEDEPVKPKKYRPVGRPLVYNEQFHCHMVKQLCLLGIIDEEICKIFGISIETFYEWKRIYPKFSEAIRNGKEVADTKVAQRLYERAMGFEHESEEIKVMSGGVGMGSYIERVPITKIYPPDTTAAIFWLKNRQPKQWRDKQEIEHSGLAPVPTELKVTLTNATR